MQSGKNKLYTKLELFYLDKEEIQGADWTYTMEGLKCQLKLFEFYFTGIENHWRFGIRK